MPRRKPATPQANRGAVETRDAYQAALQDASGLGSLQNEALDPAWPPPEDLPGGRPRKRQRKAWQEQPDGPHVETCVVWAHVSAETWPLARLPLGAVEAALPVDGSEGLDEGPSSAAGPSQANMHPEQHGPQHRPDSGTGTNGSVTGTRAGTLCIRLGRHAGAEDATVGTFVAETEDGTCVGAVRC